MKVQLRQGQILAQLKKFGQVSVMDLVQSLNVSPETIRRDLASMEKRGELSRVHGGAVIRDLRDEGRSFNARAGVNSTEKKQLVEQVLSHVYQDMVIGLDASSSSWWVAQSMPDIRCTVITNSLNNITALAAKKHVSCIMLGGVYSDKYKAFYGMLTRNNLHNLSLDLAVISCEGFDIHSGLWDSNEQNRDIKSALIHASTKTILLADASKQKKRSVIKICDYDDIDIVISHQGLSSGAQS
ncbi:DeoR/GlpR transcriptional regulator [Vibrio sp. JPW-9-11-11]|uniref:DeoR/GlpR family DNA-binding transcription regulator n=1 Tax=Vibrio sp. JPW-9-11-11 TaxID=1416532 RepID=UPI001594765F|nr:DeoR/GlpR family DNA-binding transcription regulator [Vibrio sp. JPW-9-11-11]NVD05848.1 DeoR/GlpR transcriptional regulator [Vibrio sp. JPW-9-11-11]